MRPYFLGMVACGIRGYPYISMILCRYRKSSTKWWVTSVSLIRCKIYPKQIPPTWIFFYSIFPYFALEKELPGHLPDLGPIIFSGMAFPRRHIGCCADGKDPLRRWFLVAKTTTTSSKQPTKEQQNDKHKKNWRNLRVVFLTGSFGWHGVGMLNKHCHLFWDLLFFTKLLEQKGSDCL